MNDRSNGLAPADREAAHVGHASVSRYGLVFAALCILTTLTYLFARMDLGVLHLPVALAIAGTKGTLVVLFFMHLWDHGGANRLVFVVSVFFVLLLIVGIIADVETRFELAVPRGERISERAPGRPAAH